MRFVSLFSTVNPVQLKRLRRKRLANERLGGMQNLKRAKHAIQMLSWAQELLGDVSHLNGPWDGLRQIDDNPDLLTLEYMKNGDMWGFINKVAGAGERVPNKILWKIFFCRKSAPITHVLHRYCLH